VPHPNDLAASNDAVPTATTVHDAAPHHSPSAALIEWMVFDLGNVVLYQTDSLADIARRIGASPALTPAAFRDAYNAPRRDYDLRSDPARYWAAVAATSGAPIPDAATVEDLTALDVEMWSGTEPEILAMFGDLRSAGLRLAVLSNAPVAMGDFVRRQPWARLFERIVISGEIGHIKPDAAIYDYLLRALDAPADKVAFTDDLAENIAGARARGIRGIEFHGAAPLRSQLAALGVPIERGPRAPATSASNAHRRR
jgi:putative hydrolase of the HAD superfamily